MRDQNATEHHVGRERAFADVHDAVERALKRHRGGGDARRAHAFAGRGSDAKLLKLALSIRQQLGRGVHLLTQGEGHEVHDKFRHGLDVARRVLFGAVALVDGYEHQRRRIRAHALEKRKWREVSFPIGGDRRDPRDGPRQDRRDHPSVSFAGGKGGEIETHVSFARWALPHLEQAVAAVVGEPTAFQRDLYQSVLAAEERAIARCVPGAEWKQIHLASAVDMVGGLVDLGVMCGAPESLWSRRRTRCFSPTASGIGWVWGCAPAADSRSAAPKIRGLASARSAWIYRWRSATL